MIISQRTGGGPEWLVTRSLGSGGVSVRLAVIRRRSSGTEGNAVRLALCFSVAEKSSVHAQFKGRLFFHLTWRAIGKTQMGRSKGKVMKESGHIHRLGGSVGETSAAGGKLMVLARCILGCLRVRGAEVLLSLSSAFFADSSGMSLEDATLVSVRRSTALGGGAIITSSPSPSSADCGCCCKSRVRNGKHIQ